MKNIITEYPAWAIALCPMVGLAFALLLYYRDRRLADMSSTTKTGLAVLRFLSVTAIALLILGPLIRYFDTEIEPPVVVVGLDNSRSLSLAKDSAALRESVSEMLVALDQGLSENFELVTYTFGQTVNEGRDTTFAEPLTDISAFFESIKNRYTNRNLGAVVLASDGIYNRGSNPRYAISGIRAPVFTLALGDTTIHRDALIAEVASNRIAFLGNTFPIEAALGADKLDGSNLNYSLEKDGEVLETGTFSVSGERDRKTVRFLAEAKEPGVQKYTVKISTVDGEITVANNSRVVYIDVIDSRRKVLILAAAPHPDIMALRRAISGNQNYGVEVALENEWKGNPSDFDLVVLHQMPSSATSENLKNALQVANVPLLAVVGNKTEIGRLSSFAIGVNLAAAKRGTNDVGAALNPAFKLFKVNPDLDAFLKDVPPLRIPFGEWRVTNAAEKVLVQRVGNIVTSDPLVIAGQIGDRKTGAILGEGIWRWRLYNYARDENHLMVDEFINNMVQYLSVKDDKRLFRVEAPSEVMENERTVINAELYNASYQPVNEEEVNIVFTDSEGKSYPFTFSRTETAYRLDAGVLPVGNYNYTARVERNGELLQDSGTLTVKPFALEASGLVANHALLRAISLNTGGEMFYPGQSEALVQAISNAGSMKPVSYTTEVLNSVLNLKWPFFLILLLIASEWFIRKRAGYY